MGQKILITAASSDLGIELVKALHKNNHVIATSRDISRLQKLLKKNQIDCEVLKLDLLADGDIDNVVEYFDQNGPLDVLINNAALFDLNFFEESSIDVVREVFEVNFFKTIELTKKLLPYLKSSKRGKIISISSANGLMAMPALSAYGASKWALEGFMESLRFELRGSSCQVALIEPGAMSSKMLFNAKPLKHYKSKQYEKRLNYYRQKLKDHPKHLLVSPTLVAKKVVQLIEQKEIRFRYLISLIARLKLFLKRAFPYSIYEKVISYVIESK